MGEIASVADLNWHYLGRAIKRGPSGSFDSDVTGDPCIVWDDEEQRYRMFYFAQTHTGDGSEVNCVANAVSAGRDLVGPGDWRKLGPVEYTNPESLHSGQASKPWIVMDPRRPNRPATPDGSFWLLIVSWLDGSKVIQRARAPHLSGPWTLQVDPLLSPGEAGDFDALHADTVTAYWFTEEGRVLLYYKGYPLHPQKEQPNSPWGSCLATAVMRVTDETAQKLGPVLRPTTRSGHWLSGWVSSVQLVPRDARGYWGLGSGSPTPPAPVSEQPTMREPAPSLGGWLDTQESFPVTGWRPSEKPIVALDELPAAAVEDGMGTNLWRHHLLGPIDGRLYLFCNSGPYGQEQMFVRVATLSI